MTSFLPGQFLSALIRLLHLRLAVVCAEPDDESIAGDPADLRILSDPREVGFGDKGCLILCEEGLEEAPDDNWTSAIPFGSVLLLPHANSKTFHPGFGGRLMTYEWSSNGSIAVYEWRSGRRRGSSGTSSSSSSFWPWGNWQPGATLRRETDLGGVRFAVSVIPSYPMAFVDEATGSYDGFFVEYLEEVRAACNFQVDFVSPPDGNYGTYENGSWNGIVSQLEEGEVDLALTLGMSRERAEVVDFGYSVYAVVITVLVSADTDGRRSLNFWAYVNIFGLEVWISIAAAVLLSALATAQVMATGDGHGRRKERSILDFLKRFSTALLSSFLSLIQQSCDELDEKCGQGPRDDPSVVSARVAFFTSNLSFFFLFALYTSDLTATMTTGIPAHEIASFKDLLETGATVVYVKNSLEEHLLASGSTGSYKEKMYLEHSIEALTYEEMFEKIAGSNGKIVGFGPVLSEFVDQQWGTKGLLHFAERFPVHGTFGFPRGVSFVEAFNYQIVKLRQAGVMKTLTDKWLRGDVPPDYSDRIFFAGNASPLGFSNLIFPALTLLAGLLASVIFVCIEKSLKRKTAKNTNVFNL